MEHPKCQALLAAISTLKAQIQGFEQDKKAYQEQVKVYNKLIYGVPVDQAEDFDYKGMYYPAGTTLPEYSQW
jgi:hypothetical protein